MVQRFSVDTGGYGFQDVTHCVPIGTDLVAYIDYAALEQRCKELDTELQYIDIVLARRPALDGFNGRVEKIDHAINVAKKADKLEAMSAELKDKADIWKEEWRTCVAEKSKLKERVKELEAEYATDVGRLVSDMRYIQGIVERGTGKPVDEKLPVTGQILEYVKSLEAENAELKEKGRP